MRDGDKIDSKSIVFKVADGADPKQIYCTTYQMRDFYLQMRDGFFTNLDVMNYIQHYVAATMPRKNARILDVCCGRALLLPLLRYNNKEISEYVGVDISTRNLAEAKRRIADKVFPFNVVFVECDASKMSQEITDSFDCIIYTSSIEHMHKDVGENTLRECYKLLKDSGTLFLSCPNTSGNGYETQYAAHVYEWGIDELRKSLNEIGFVIDNEVGLVMAAKEMKRFFESDAVPPDVRNFYDKMRRYLPTKFLSVFMAIPYPDQAKEVLLIAKKGR